MFASIAIRPFIRRSIDLLSCSLDRGGPKYDGDHASSNLKWRPANSEVSEMMDAARMLADQPLSGGDRHMRGSLVAEKTPCRRA